VKVLAKCFLKEDLQRTPKLKDSLLSEILILRRLQHPNVISLEEVHEDASSVYLIYPITNGGDLFEHFRSRKLTN
jgi:calcium-dependent protein kinase